MTQSKSQNFCPYCGAPIASPQAHFCGNCGKALPAGMNDIPQMKKDADKISPEVKEAPASPVKEDASAATESAPGIPAEPENNPAVQENAEVQKKPAAEAHTESHFPDIAPEGAEPQQPASNPVIKEHTGPLPQPEIPYTPAFKHSKDDGFSDPSFRGMFFSFHGRLNRKRYFWRSVTIFGLILAGIVGAVIFFGMVEAMGEGMEFADDSGHSWFGCPVDWLIDFRHFPPDTPYAGFGLGAWCRIWLRGCIHCLGLYRPLAFLQAQKLIPWESGGSSRFQAACSSS